MQNGIIVLHTGNAENTQLTLCLWIYATVTTCLFYVTSEIKISQMN